MRQENHTTRRLAAAPEESDTLPSTRIFQFSRLCRRQKTAEGLGWSTLVRGCLIRQSAASPWTFKLQPSGLLQPPSGSLHSSEKPHHVANLCDAALAGHRGSTRGHRVGRSRLTRGLTAWRSLRRCGRRVFPVVPAPGPGHGLNTLLTLPDFPCGLSPHSSSHP